MASSTHSSHDRNNHAYLYVHVKNARNVYHDDCNDHDVSATRHDVVYSSYAMTASSSSSHSHGRSRPRRHPHHVVSHAPKTRNASHSISYSTIDASNVLYCKYDRVVASNVGPKSKNVETYIWVPKSYATNLTGPNTSWVPKPQA
jgi:5-keto 4-deoxyuronate isomerase